MNNIQAEFMELIAHLQLTALDLLSKNEYDNVIELLNDSLDEIFDEKEEVENETRTMVASSNRVFATVDRQRVMQEIGDNQALMIFAQEVENDEEF